jgi:hypothetical protein
LNALQAIDHESTWRISQVRKVGFSRSIIFIECFSTEGSQFKVAHLSGQEGGLAPALALR